MGISRLSFLGSPNIGLFALTNDYLTIIPVQISRKKTKIVHECLRVEITFTTVGGSRLVGVLAVANSNGIILPHYAQDEEIKQIKNKWAGSIDRINSKKTALGNLILVNDYGALASPQLIKEKVVLRKIRDVLDVEIVPSTIAGLPYVGSLATATNKGVIVHPILRNGESQLLHDVLKVPVYKGTINGGSPFISSGLLANNHGVLIGTPTTGPEIMVITLFDS